MVMSGMVMSGMVRMGTQTDLTGDNIERLELNNQLHLAEISSMRTAMTSMDPGRGYSSRNDLEQNEKVTCLYTRLGELHCAHIFNLSVV